MATNERPERPDDESAAKLAEQLRQSAQQIWLAGMGAFAKAQAEGSKLFDTLVKEGSALQRNTQATAGERFAEAGERFAQAGDRMANLANDLSARASGLFESRVAKAMANLGVPPAGELESLAARVEELERKVARLTARPATPRRRPARSEPKPAAPRARPRDAG